MQCPRLLILSASAMSALWFNGQSEAVSEPFGLNSKGGAQNSQDGMIGVQRSVDGWGEKRFWIMLFERLLDDALARARLPDEDAEPTLLAMYP